MFHLLFTVLQIVIKLRGGKEEQRFPRSFVRSVSRFWSIWFGQNTDYDMSILKAFDIISE